MNRIRTIVRHSEYTAEVVIENDSIARSARPGHFVMVRFTSDCPRIPFTIIDTSVAEAYIYNYNSQRCSLGWSDRIALRRLWDRWCAWPIGTGFRCEKFRYCCLLRWWCWLCTYYSDYTGFEKRRKPGGDYSFWIHIETSCLRANVEAYSDEILHSSDETRTLELVRQILTDRAVDLMVMTGPTSMMKKSRNVPVSKIYQHAVFWIWSCLTESDCVAFAG